MRFLALDVETATSHRWSICQIGLVDFDHGEEVDACGLLVQPHCAFSPFNIGLHGIAARHVEGAPDFPAIFPSLASALAGAVVVSHTSFDRDALGQACARYGLAMPECRWIDSAEISRQAWPGLQGGYSLTAVAQAMGMAFRHHDAVEDARACGRIVVRAAQQTRMSLEDLALAVTKAAGRARAWGS